VTEVLAQLLARLDQHGSVTVRSHELGRWPAGVRGGLVRHGLLVRHTNETGLVCDGCEEGCWVVPERFRRHDGDEVLLTACTGRNPEVHGTVTFPLSRLEAWRFSPKGLAQVLATALELRGRVEEIEGGWLWSLGAGHVAGAGRLVFFATSLVGEGTDGRADRLLGRIGNRAALVLVPTRTAPVGTVPVVALDGLVAMDGDGLVLDRELVALSLPSPGPMMVHDAPPPSFRARPDTGWSQVKIWFVDGDTVRIVLPDRPPRSFTAAEIGLTNARSRDRRRTKGWSILEALCEGHGTCSRHVAGVASYDAFKVQVSQLGKVLREFVGIDESPFHPTSRKDGLRSVFEAGPLPEPDLYVGEDQW